MYGDRYRVVNSATGGVRQTFEVDSSNSVEQARDMAQAAAANWNDTAPHYGRMVVEIRR